MEHKYPTIHFIWGFSKPHFERPPLTDEGKRIVLAAKNCMPQCEIKIWYPEEAEEFVRTECPEEYEFYKSLYFWIQRCDYVRYLIMYKRGGIYMDLDYELRKNLMDYWEKFDLILPRELFRHCVSNFFMMSKPGHPVWPYILAKCHQNTSDINIRGIPSYICPYWWEFHGFGDRWPISEFKEQMKSNLVPNWGCNNYVLLSTGPYSVEGGYNHWEHDHSTFEERKKTHLLEPWQSCMAFSNLIFGLRCFVPSDAVGIHYAFNEWTKFPSRFLRKVGVVLIWVLMLWFLLRLFA